MIFFAKKTFTLNYSIFFTKTYFMMKTMFKNLLWLFCVSVVLPLSSYAQTPEKDLENAIEHYNALRALMTGVSKPAAVTPDLQRNVKERHDKGLTLLDNVISTGTAEQIKTARYFAFNLKYKYAFLFGIKGENTTAYNAMKAIKNDLPLYTQANNFPFRYRKEEKNFIVKYDDFSSTIGEFYTGYSELALKNKNLEESFDYARKAYNFANKSAWLHYIALNQLIITLIEKKEYNADLARYAMEQIQWYAQKLKAEDHAIIDENKFATPLSRSRTLKTVLDKTPDFADRFRVCGEAAKVLMNQKKRDDSHILDFFEIAIKEAVTLNEAIDFAKSRLDAKNREFATSKVDENQFVTRLKQLGRDAIDRRYPNVTTAADCSAMTTVAELYEKFEAKDKARRLRDGADACAKKQRREQWKRDNPFNVYLGIYPFLLMAKVEDMDFGGHLDFRGGRNAHSLGYTLVQNKRDYTIIMNGLENTEDSKVYWDGFKARYAYKHFAQKGGTYMGLMLTYADKKYKSILSDVTINNRTLNAAFNATEKQYEAMYIFGIQILGKGVGMDYHLGLGASYNEFNGGNATYWKKEGTTIANSFLTKRPQRAVYPQFRMAYSIGLNFGRKR
jgi:hypothetical protein